MKLLKSIFKKGFRLFVKIDAAKQQMLADMAARIAERDQRSLFQRTTLPLEVLIQ